jgi:hypothetical protein
VVGAGLDARTDQGKGFLSEEGDLVVGESEELLGAEGAYTYFNSFQYFLGTDLLHQFFCLQVL